MPTKGFRRELLQSKHVSNGPVCSRSLDDVSERDGTTLLKVFRKRKSNALEKSSHIYQCREKFSASKKQTKEIRSSVNKGPQLLKYEEKRYSHGDLFRSKTGPSSTHSNGGIVLRHSFDGDSHIGHKDDAHQDTRSIGAKQGPEQQSKGKPLHVGSPKHSRSRTFKSPSLKVGPMPQQVNGGTRFCEHASSFSSPLLEAKRQGHFQVLPNTSADDEGSPLSRDDSSELDVDAESNPQSSPKVVRKNSRPVLSVRKSSRVPKRRILDGDDVEVARRPRKKIEHEPHVDYDGDNTQTGDDQLLSEDERIKVPSSSTPSEFLEPDFDEKEFLLTARKHAVKASKEGREAELGTNLDMSDGLLPEQKETPTEAQQAIKKEEAARRRKQQMERNTKEIQALAIQKILGQESSRKKREEKLQKQRQEIEEEKRAASMAPAVNSIRWVMGPSGNTVSFSEDVELSKIFSGACSYPGEREKCAGPSCYNAYKYRDSKTLLPLCSLECYKAVQRVPPTAGPAF